MKLLFGEPNPFEMLAGPVVVLLILIGLVIGVILGACIYFTLLRLQGLRVRFAECIGGMITISCFNVFLSLVMCLVLWWCMLFVSVAIRNQSELSMGLASNLAIAMLIISLWGIWIQFRFQMDLFKTSFFRILLAQVSYLITIFAAIVSIIGFLELGLTFIFLVILVNYLCRPAHMRIRPLSAIGDLCRRRHEVPSDPQKLLQKGIMFAREGYYDKSEKTLSKIIKENPKHIDALFYLGALHYKMDRHDQARKYWGKVLKLDPLHEKANKYMAILVQNPPA